MNYKARKVHAIRTLGANSVLKLKLSYINARPHPPRIWRADGKMLAV